MRLINLALALPLVAAQSAIPGRSTQSTSQTNRGTGRETGTSASATRNLYIPSSTSAGTGATGAAAANTAQSITSGSPAATGSATSSATYQTTAITACHWHGTQLFCVNGAGAEGVVSGISATKTEDTPKSFTGCHAHGAAETYCMVPGGGEVLFVAEGSASAASGSGGSSSSYQTTAITACHWHETILFCVNGAGAEGVVSGVSATKTEDTPKSFTGCHAHDASETYCMAPGGGEVQFVAEGGSSGGESHGGSNGEMNCHFHAGVEHCVGPGGESDTKAASCERRDRKYNIPLRIGLLFVILVTSALGSIGPIFIKKMFNVNEHNIFFVMLKQFGTGVIISTALIHLITHAEMMWKNKCLTGLKYEATGTAITMAGLFVAFILEYIAHRCFNHSHSAHPHMHENHEPTEITEAGGNSDVEKDGVLTKNSSDDGSVEVSNKPNSNISVLTMEAGIIFHSILIGITLVVAGDSFFITLFIVILFHQIFEGLALGTRIAELKETGLLAKLIMGGVFAIITPIGMAIGIGVLSKFNGNDKSTLIALGTLDSFSAGVLLWTGIVEMWAADWVFGELRNSKWLRTGLALGSMVVGMILMSLLGKWA